ncbi:MAG: orotidine-5'-phosphate decarboxylase, partial [Aquificae bacterium]|nr:orotidine-5'-phosphate decarboxylase [Aquificota bacterium]
MGVKIALALDVKDLKEAYSLLKELEGEELIIKVGYSLFIKGGRDLLKAVK